jgi:hypothetical protein
MKKPSLRTRFTRLAMAVMVGGSPLALSGCDPVVRDTVLGGLESTTTSLATTIIQAYFISLQEEGGDDSGSLTTT